MGYFGNLKKDYRTEWNAFQSNIDDLHTDKATTVGGALRTIGKELEYGSSFLLNAGASTVLQAFSSAGATLAGATVQDGTSSVPGTYGTSGTFSQENVGAYDTYSSFYTFAHPDNFKAPTGDGITLYAFNNIPITTNGQTGFQHVSIA